MCVCCSVPYKANTLNSARAFSSANALLRNLTAPPVGVLVI